MGSVGSLCGPSAEVAGVTFICQFCCYKNLSVTCLNNNHYYTQLNSESNRGTINILVLFVRIKIIDLWNVSKKSCPYHCSLCPVLVVDDFNLCFCLSPLFYNHLIVFHHPHPNPSLSLSLPTGPRSRQDVFSSKPAEKPTVLMRSSVFLWQTLKTFIFHITCFVQYWPQLFQISISCLLRGCLLWRDRDDISKQHYTTFLNDKQ